MHYSHQQLHQSPADTRVDDGLNLLIGPIGKVGQGPAGVGQQVDVAAEEQTGQHRQARAHLQGAAQHSMRGGGEKGVEDERVRVREREGTQQYIKYYLLRGLVLIYLLIQVLFIHTLSLHKSAHTSK